MTQDQVSEHMKQLVEASYAYQILAPLEAINMRYTAALLAITSLFVHNRISHVAYANLKASLRCAIIAVAGTIGACMIAAAEGATA